MKAEVFFQQIMSLYDVEGAYERWEKYRKRVTEHLISNMDKNKNIAILGVGKANDIDLSKIHNHAKKLTLVDIDLDSIRSGIGKYGLENSEKINIVKADFVGISKSDYIGAIGIVLNDISSVQSGFSERETGLKYLRKMEEIFRKVNRQDIDLGIEEQDYVILIGVHSQLFDKLAFIWGIVLEAVQKDIAADSPVMQELKNQCDLFIPRFDDAIMARTKEKAFVGIETKESKYGVTPQGALQANIDIEKKVNFEHLKRYNDKWPFSAEKTYEMSIFDIPKKYYRSF